MQLDNILNKRILGQTRKAVQDFNMINKGDRIAVGISGGKDSMSMVYALSLLKKFYPESFSLHGITIMSGVNDFDPDMIVNFMDMLDIPYTVEETYIGQLVFNIRKEKNPCSLCANMRRGALNNKAIELGCNKIALAHNRDDVIETYMLSMMYEGRFHTFSPVTYLDRKEITVIRPFIYCKEHDILGYTRQNNIPVVKSPCPYNGMSKRQEVKDMLKEMIKSNPDIKSNIFGSIQRSGNWGW